MKMVFFLLLASSAFAGEKSPCGADGPRVCPGVPFKGGQMFRCLRKKLAQVSEGCRTHVEKLSEHKTICRREIEKHCQKQPFYCLLYPSKARVKLSQACASDVLEKATIVQLCATEINKHCVGSHGSHLRLLNCLEGTPGISQGCKDALDK